jgi:hypothetical protein
VYKPQAAIAAVLLALSGCAAIQRQTLSAQGGPAPRALQVRQLTASTRNGSTTYEFYDPQFCRCIYVGGAKEYAELKHPIPRSGVPGTPKVSM